ncbi:MAG: glycoside hydrolase domain-containing protein [Planctomycetota bacterium]|jgi:hypothetical protein
MFLKRSCFGAAVFIVFSLQAGFLSAEDKSFADRQLNIYWVDKPITLDGKMNEECWKNAEVIGNFRKFQKSGEAAENQTEVRVCYDAKNLYFFWRLYKKDMSKLLYGVPEDARDILNFSTSDVAEFFIDPGHSRKNYCQLAASPLGTRHDWSRTRRSNFNPDWKVKTSIEKDHWAAEMIIPFAELAAENEYIATPQKGEQWGMQFCREEPDSNALTQWQVTNKGFHQVKNYPAVTFMGIDTAVSKTKVKLTEGMKLFFGKFEIPVEITAPRSVEVSYTIYHEDKVVRQEKIKAEKKLLLPVEIYKGGKWTVNLSLLNDGEIFYYGTQYVRLPELRKLLGEMEENITMARPRLKKFRHPNAGQLLKRLDKFTAEAMSSIKTIKSASSLTVTKWQDLIRKSKLLRSEWEKIKFDLYLTSLYPANEKSLPFTTSFAKATDKIYRIKTYQGAVKEEIRLNGAGNEYESFQLILIPFWRDLKKVSVKCSPLKGVNESISAENITFSVVDYVRMNKPHPTDLSPNKFEPDILWSDRVVKVKEGQVQSLWFDVKIPAGTSEGLYEGIITVEAGGYARKLKVVVNAFGFDIPKFSTLENNFWFSPGVNWSRFYGKYGALDYPPELFERHARVLSRYRISSFADDWMTMRRKVKIIREKDGTYNFDFTELAKLVEIGKKYGANAYRASHGCNLGVLSPFYNNLRVSLINKKDKTPYLYQCDDLKTWKEDFKAGREYFDTHPVYSAYLPALVKFLKKMNILDRAYFEIYDEPNSNPRWLDMIRHHSWLRKHVPELKLTAFGPTPLTVKAGKNAAGLLDVWGPALNHIKDKDLKAIYARRKKYGDKFWFYTCNSREQGKNYTPFIFYNQSYLAPRIHSWFAWQKQADGMLIFAMTGVPKSNIKKSQDKRWPHTEWLADQSRGCGTLVYPGPDKELIPSIRLANIRDGLDDYEYFYLLNKLSAQLDNNNHKSLIAEIKKTLLIEEDIIKDVYVWTKDQEVLEKKRMQLAGLIVRVNKILGKDK